MSAVLWLWPRSAGTSRHARPKRVLVMHWYDRGFPPIELRQAFQAALRSATPEGVEYYSEYLETNRFPGEDQARLLSDYLRQKYAGRKIDVIVSRASPPLDFF